MDLELDAKERVYLDSTIPSYYFDEREEIRTFSEITRRWWNEMSERYDTFVSLAVIEEIQEGEYPRQGDVLEFSEKLPVLDLTPEIQVITDTYIRHMVMPDSLFGDATHLAYASFYGLDYLLTWNCNHLANANKKKHIQVINKRLGLLTPEIVTPMVLFKEDIHDD